MIAKIVNVIKISGWMHEIFHWIPAKLLTTNVTAYPDHVTYDLPDEQWKNLVIISGPLVAGLTFLGLVRRGISKKRIDRGWMDVVLLYLCTSFWDVVGLAHFLRHGEWSEDVKRRI